ncbi:unnamed protein product, partial [Prorocentrum cordatum]
YGQRSLVKAEGKSLGDFSAKRLDECAKKCDETPECHSFSYSANAWLDGNKGCNLKDKVVTAGEAGSDSLDKGDYKTYYKVAAGADFQSLHAASVLWTSLAKVTPFHAVCVLAVCGAVVALLTLAVLSRASSRRFDRVPTASSDAALGDEPLVTATAE